MTPDARAIQEAREKRRAYERAYLGDGMNDEVRQKVENLLQLKRDQNTLIPRIANVARVLALSQADIAQMAGVTQSALSRWMSGDRTPRPQYIPALRSVLEALETAAQQ